ncbi:hypothetical protein B0H13DRAFT_1868089 [Mycena leptocephala]|nr:hypothetical protein B0H13DRAFT_1868089 [Mycena leptocephala]
MEGPQINSGCGLVLTAQHSDLLTVAPTIAALPQNVAGPPKNLALRRWEAVLPQYDLVPPFPEGKTGRYLKFLYPNPNQGEVGWEWGWNEYFGTYMYANHIINHDLIRKQPDACAPGVYIGTRTYSRVCVGAAAFRWSKAKCSQNICVRTRRDRLWASNRRAIRVGRSAPRAVPQDWFDVVCPKTNAATSHTSSHVNCRRAAGIRVWDEILAHWQTVLRDADCGTVRLGGGFISADIRPPSLESPRILALWDFSHHACSTPRQSWGRPLRETPPIIPRGPHRPHPAPRDPFQRMLAMHVRRGDYEAHCRVMSHGNEGFYGWNLFPQLPDHLVPELELGAPEKQRSDQAGVVRRVAEVRREYLVHATQSNATVDVVYILSNEKGAWIDGLKMLQKEGWMVVASQDLVLDAEQKAVSMAVDMEIARRAAVNVVRLLSSAHFLFAAAHLRNTVARVKCISGSSTSAIRSPFVSRRGNWYRWTGGKFRRRTRGLSAIVERAQTAFAMDAQLTRASEVVTEELMAGSSDPVS